MYFLAFFFGILWLMAMPAMLDVARNVPPGPAQREAAREATAAAVRPKLPVALGLALLATGLGIYTGRLPGTRPPDGAR
ncbi:MAG: hypothetical protein JSU66_01405 [Deltaproteobacteria bacterium]|nr:MAG: hypothetical protein JSU66_01405 [Deltaproteobacteria bacterium]